MENLLTFTTSQLFIYLASLPLFVTSLILVKKYFVKQRPSFDFNASHYLIGLAVSLITSLAVVNLEVSNEPMDYQVEVGIEEPIVNIPRTTQKQLRKAVPPPPKPKKLIKKLDLTKLKLVKDELVIKKEAPLVDESDIPTLPVVAVTKATPSPPAPKPIIEDEPDFIFVAEQMPRFPGCEDLDTEIAKEKCSKLNLLNYIYDNLKYPPYARDNGIEGMVVLQFVVSKEGRIEDLKIARDIGGGCGGAAAKVVSSMNDLAMPWTAGRQRGKPVKVLYTLPVKFKLNR